MYASISNDKKLTVGFLKDSIDLATVPVENVTLSILKANVNPKTSVLI